MEVPYSVKKLNEEDRARLKTYYTGEAEYVQLGAKEYLLDADFMKYAAEIYNMELRPTDIFVATYQRSGTTWTQELVWLLVNDLDFEKASSIVQTTRFPFLEMYMFYNSILRVAPEAKLDPPGPEIFLKMPDPRFIKTHLPMSLLPEKILDISRVVYVARDPRDVVVSCYHFFKSLPFMKLNCTFKEFFDMFLKDLSYWSPFWDHIEEAWTLRDHPNMLFLFYEELSKDLKSCAKRVAKFLNKEYNDEQLDKLCEHLRIDNFQKNKALHVDNSLIKDMNKFIRKGKAGGWRDEFDSEMTERACTWMRENMRKRSLDLPWTLE